MRVSRSAVAAATVAVLALSACANDSDTDTGSDPDVTTEGGQSGTFPVTIEHAFGETTIDSQPERVATVGWSNQEAALALNVVPVLMEEITWGDDDDNGVLPWVEEALAELGAPTPAMYDPTDGVDFEAVGDSDPDLILAAYSGLSEDDYNTLSDIAPVVAYPEVAWGTTWQQTLEVNGAGLGLESEAQALVEDLQDEISDGVAAQPNLDSGQGAAFVFFDVNDLSNITFYTTIDPRARFLTEEAGFTLPAVVEAADQSEFLASMSAESVDELSDVDVIVTYGTGEELEALQADPLLSRIPAVANGAIVWLDEAVDPTTATSANPSPLGIAHLVENYLPLLNEAAGNAG